MSNNATPQGITPEVGKRYVTRGGWVTPPLEVRGSITYPFCVRMKNGTISMSWMGNGTQNGMDESEFDLIAEYVEPTQPDTFRRDLEAALFVAMIGGSFSLPNIKSYDSLGMANVAIKNADTLIEAQEAAK